MSLNFSQIEQLIESSRYPIPDLWLEGLQDKFQQYENYYRFGSGKPSKYWTMPLPGGSIRGS